jgi:hypothetical protein
MSCTEEAKKEILAHIVGFTQQHEASGVSVEELQYEMNALVLQLNHRYGADCVLEVLRALNPMMTRILN